MPAMVERQDRRQVPFGRALQRRHVRQTWKTRRPRGRPTVLDCNEWHRGRNRTQCASAINLRNKHEAKRRGFAWSRDGGLAWSEPKLDHALIRPHLPRQSVERAARRKTVPRLLQRGRAGSGTIDRARQRRRGTALVGRRCPPPRPRAYSCLAPLNDGLVACLFEAGDAGPYERLVFATFAFDDVAAATGGTALTEPGVALTFDDAHVAEWTTAMPLFEQYDAHATFFVSQFDKLTAEQIEGLRRLQAAVTPSGCQAVRHPQGGRLRQGALCSGDTWPTKSRRP